MSKKKDSTSGDKNNEFPFVEEIKKTIEGIDTSKPSRELRDAILEAKDMLLVKYLEVNKKLIGGKKHGLR